MLKVGIVGIGGMGRKHFGCYGNNPNAKVVALCDVEENKRTGNWPPLALNVGESKNETIDMTGISSYADVHQMIANTELDAIDICLPTPLHVATAIAALQAGKHVLCEKPMAWSGEDCAAMQAAAEANKRTFLIGHCLRYWPHYVKGKEAIESGEYGKVLYAKFHRAGDTPIWSWDDWLRDGKRSGGAVFDMHIHDVDTALWWFGKPDQIRADGLVLDGLPMRVDASWRYNDGPLVSLYGAWDNNGGDFKMAYELVMEKATLVMDTLRGPNLTLLQNGEATEIEMDSTAGYQYEIDDFVEAAIANRPVERVTPESSRQSVEVVLEEMRQMGI